MAEKDWVEEGVDIGKKAARSLWVQGGLKRRQRMSKKGEGGRCLGYER
jgi:hypothetical protein